MFNCHNKGGLVVSFSRAKGWSKRVGLRAVTRSRHVIKYIAIEVSSKNTDLIGNPDEIDKEFCFLWIELWRADGDNNPRIVAHMDCSGV